MSQLNTDRSRECLRISDQLKRGFEGPAWHGPALLEILADVDAENAASHSIPNAHSIWELVLHISAWERIILRRLNGEALTLEGQEDFPAVPDTSDNAWRSAIAELKTAHAELVAATSQMSDLRLTGPVPGKDYDVYFMLHGAVQHALYHAGQIALLRKAWSASL